MKAFLFLYPVTQYFDEDGPGVHDKAIERLNEIVDARYRQKGYHVYWLCFGTEASPAEPDLSMLDDRVRVEQDDRVVSCGVSFRTHQTPLYPSCQHILGQLAQVEHLVLGGFHQADCVDKLARAAHEAHILVEVDEDTTNIMLCFAEFDALPPVTRTRAEYAAYFRDFLNRLVVPVCGEQAVEADRIERSSRPWLTPI